MATLVASGTITQAGFVKIDPNSTGGAGLTGQLCGLMCAANSDAIYGVSDVGVRQAAYPGLDDGNVAIAGEEFHVFTFDEIPANAVLLQIGAGGCNPGDRLTSDSAGSGVVTTTTGQWVGAIALQKATAGQRANVKLISPAQY
jgi:hypothetical protein